MAESARAWSPTGGGDASLRVRSAVAKRRAKAWEELNRRNAMREMGWNSTPHRTCPSYLRGLKPITPEPWSVDAIVYATKSGSFESVRNADKFGDGTQKEEVYNDESSLDTTNGYESNVVATGRAKPGRWDSSPLRHTPYALRGISPVTREPWAVDLQVYNRNSTRTESYTERGESRQHMRQRAATPCGPRLGRVITTCTAPPAHTRDGRFSCALAAEPYSEANRARLLAKTIDRPGFFLPHYEKWAALLSA
jgi:hypothetical protein